MERWRVGQMDEWMDGQIAGQKEGWTKGRGMDGWTESRMDAGIDRQMDRGMDGWTEGWMDK